MPLPRRPTFEQVLAYPVVAVKFANLERDKARARKRARLAFVEQWQDAHVIVYLWKVLVWAVRIRADNRRNMIQQIERGA